MGRTRHYIKTGESSVAFVSLEMTSAEVQARVKAACAVPDTKEKDRGMTPTKIKAIRNQSQLSQAMFASRLGLSVRTVQEWEQGRRKPNGPAQSLLVP